MAFPSLIEVILNAVTFEADSESELGLGLGDEDIVVAKSTNAEDAKFDQVIGAIEEIIMEDKFRSIQDEFMHKNYKHFEESDENKLIYTTVHNEYVSLIEKYLDAQLKKKVKQFNMDEFMKTLLARREELEGEIFELLLTFDDFVEFKQLMLSFKSVSALRIYTVTTAIDSLATPLNIFS